MRIHWFAPLPPERTEIANHVARVLPALASCAPVTLWTSQARWDKGLEASVRIRRFHPAELGRAALHRELDDGNGIAVFEIGNNLRYHGDLFAASRSHPGIVVLHDPTMLQFLAGYDALRRHRPWDFLARMHRSYGEDGVRAGWELVTGRRRPEDLVTRYPLTQEAVDGALGVITHGVAPPELRRGAGPRFVRSLALPLAPRFPPRSFPSLGSELRLVVFGFLSRNRRLAEILEVLAAWRGRTRFRLDVYGRINGEPGEDHRIRGLVLRHRLQDLVSIHGFVPEGELREALDRAHLVLNLRDPTMGEASATQLRIWEHARPALITPVGWYAEQPEGLFAAVRPGHEREDIPRHLDALLRDPSSFAAMGLRGRAWLEAHHGVKAYARGLVVASERALQGRAASVGEDLARHVGGELARWCPPHLAGGVLRRVSRVAAHAVPGASPAG